MIFVRKFSIFLLGGVFFVDAFFFDALLFLTFYMLVGGYFGSLG